MNSVKRSTPLAEAGIEAAWQAALPCDLWGHVRGFPRPLCPPERNAICLNLVWIHRGPDPGTYRPEYTEDRTRAVSAAMEQRSWLVQSIWRILTALTPDWRFMADLGHKCHSKFHLQSMMATCTEVWMPHKTFRMVRTPNAIFYFNTS